MKNTDKVTMTIDQLKKLVKESKSYKRISEAGPGPWKANFYKASDFESDDPEVVMINSLADLQKLAATDNCYKLVLDWDPLEDDVDLDITLYDDWIE